MVGNLLACPRLYKSKFALESEVLVRSKVQAKKRGGHMKQFTVGKILFDA